MSCWRAAAALAFGFGEWTTSWHEQTCGWPWRRIWSSLAPEVDGAIAVEGKLA